MAPNNYTYKEKEVEVETALYNFKKLQKWFEVTGELVCIKCFHYSQEVSIHTRPSGYEDSLFIDYRKHCFDKYTVRNEAVEYLIIKHIHEEELLDVINNDNLLYWFGMTCESLKLHLTLEQLLICLKEYKQNGFTPIERKSILDLYLEEPLPTLVKQRELVAA